MKYGETLRQRSIPAWSHHNIDYDDIKQFIKENTTPGKGKTVSVPGRGDEKLRDFENSLFLILVEQHQRIDLFVKSKAGEIQRRLDHSKSRLQQLASRRSSTTTDNRIPVSRLERYSRLENDVIKAGEEIRSLARFTATQRTAFRKLLKKYKKWTGSTDLEDRFRHEVLDSPKSFTNLDLGPLLDDYSLTQQKIRTLYDGQLQRSAGGPRALTLQSPISGSSTIKQLQEAIDAGSKVIFDTSMAAIPLGESGAFASYFVHPENIVELQMLLLQYARFYQSRSRSNSIATPVSSEPQTAALGNPRTDVADYHMLTADNLERFAKEQSSLTVNEREHSPGSFPQKAKAAVRWNNTEDALACLRSNSGKTKRAYMKRKHIGVFFDKDADFSPKQDLTLPDTPEHVQDLRRELLKDDIKPLFQYSACRSRLSGLDDGQDGLILATLDTGITIKRAGAEKENNAISTFPFALLLVRQEGSPKSNLVAALDDSHLVERVRGFSVEYHSIWQTHRPTSIPAPFWLPTLSQDIRKLPPPALKRPSATEVNSSGSGTARSSGSITGVTDSTTAVEREIPPQLESPPLRSFRKKKKKKRRGYAEESAAQQRYWSEYDHPEDGNSDEDAYVIYIDPNERSMLDQFFEKLSSLFRRKDAEKEPLISTPGTPVEDEVSSDDEEAGLVAPRNRRGFGTFAKSGTEQQGYAYAGESPTGLSHLSGTCFVASLAMLVVAYILHSTGKKKFLREVHYGVLFAIICSLAFMLGGFMSVLRSKRPLSLFAWAISIVVLLLDAVGSGGLLAWMLG